MSPIVSRAPTAEKYAETCPTDRPTPPFPDRKYGLYCGIVKHADAKIRTDTGINEARAE